MHDDDGVECSAQLSLRMPPRRSGRLAPPPPGVVQEYVLDPRLVSDVLAAVFALVPVDTRLRCREVSKAWRAFLDQPWLWQSVNLSPASGLVAKPTCALLRAATLRAQGQLRVLDVSDCHGFTFPTLVEVVRANRETLTTLKSWACAFNVNDLAEDEFLLDDDELPELLAAAKEGVLQTLECGVCPSPALGCAILRGEPPHSVLRVRRMRIEGARVKDGEYEKHKELDFRELCEAMRGNASLRSLALADVTEDALPQHIEPLVDSCILCRLQTLSIFKGGLTPALLPPLTRLVREVPELRTLHLGSSGEATMRGPALPAFLAALRGCGVTSLCLSGMDLFGALEEDPDEYLVALRNGFDVLEAVVGHPTVQELYVSSNYALSCENQLGATVARLLDSPSALQVLDLSDCGLADAASAPIFAALARNTQLRRLDYRFNNMSELCAQRSVLPCATANVTLAELRFMELDDDEEIPIELLRAEQMVKERGNVHVHTPH